MINKQIFELYCKFVAERESIRLKKESGLPKPWTKDKILQQYRFCNMRRMDDKVSKWLFLNWYNKLYNHEMMLPACCIARFINKPETLRYLGPLIFYKWNPQRIISKIREMQAEGLTPYSAAYMVRCDKGVDKIEYIVDLAITPMLNSINFFKSLKTGEEPFSTDTMKGVWEMLMNSRGFGSFMAGQIVADLRWAVKGDWSDRNVWAPIGPGSKKGMNILLEKDENEPLSQSEFLQNLKELVSKAKPKLVLSHPSFKRMEMIDWQNTLCEFSKYFRVLEGYGRPKQKYKGC